MELRALLAKSRRVAYVARVVASEVWDGLLSLPMLVVGFVRWLTTIGAKPGWAATFHYGSLVVAAISAAWVLGRQRSSRFKKWLAVGLVVSAWIGWLCVDRYSERFPLKDYDGFDDVTYSRFGTPLHEDRWINWGAPSWSRTHYSGPLDSHGEHHGRWEMYDSRAEPRRVYEWYFHGEKVSAVEYQAMIKDSSYRGAQ